MALSLVALRVVPRRDGCWAMTASQATQRLGNLREGSRQSAIAVLARSGQIASPLSGSDGASLLSGTTQGARAGAIRELAALFKGDLSGQETEAILGTEATLFEDNRQGAIAALARAKRFGPSLSEDAALALKGTTQRSRAGSIAEIAPYLRAGVTGQTIATILGAGPLLSDGNRQGAIAAIARSGKKPLPLSGADGAAILQGSAHVARAGSIGELAPLFRSDLSGQEADAILGSETTLSEGNRQRAIAALARSQRFGPSLSEDAALALKGTTQGSRAGSIAEIAPYLRAGLTGQAIATILGDGSLLSEGNRAGAIAAIARSGKKPLPLSGAEGAAILQGTTQSARVASIREIARFFVAGMPGDKVALILGASAESTEGHRYGGLDTLVRAGVVTTGIIGPELESVLRGMSGQTKTAAIALLNNAVVASKQTSSLTGAAPQPPLTRASCSSLL